MAGGRAGQRERLMLPRRRPAHAAVRARPRSSSATLRTRHSRRSSHSLLPRRHPAHEARVGGRKSGVERTTDPSASTQARTFGSMTLRASQRGALMIAVRTAFEDSLSRQRRLRAQHELRAPAGSSSGASACSARRAAKTSQATPAAFCPHSLPQAESEPATASAAFARESRYAAAASRASSTQAIASVVEMSPPLGELLRARATQLPQLLLCRCTETSSRRTRRVETSSTKPEEEHLARR